MGSVLRGVRLEQVFLGKDVVRVGRAAEPDVGRGVALLFFDLRLHLAGGQTLIVDLDAVQFLEMLARSGEIFLFAGAVNGQLTLRLRGGDQIRHRVRLGRLFGRGLRLGSRGFGGRGGRFGRAAAGGKREHHDQSQKQCQILFHVFFLRSNMFRYTIPDE